MKKIISVTAFTTSLSLLSGCASIVSGTTQNVSVETPPVTGATCESKNNKGTWLVQATPGSVIVHKSTQPLLVSCKKSGHKIGYQTFQSNTEGMIAGNLLLGGPIGAGVDAATGAAFDYPASLIVPMQA